VSLLLLADAVMHAAESADVALDPRTIEASVDRNDVSLWVENTRVSMVGTRSAIVQSQLRPLEAAAGHAVAEIVRQRLNKFFRKRRASKERPGPAQYGNHVEVMAEARLAAKVAGMRHLVTRSDEDAGIHIEAAVMEYLPHEDRPNLPGRWRVTSPLGAEYSDYLDHALMDALWAAVWVRAMGQFQ
jgi:hypothetical protein